MTPNTSSPLLARTVWNSLADRTARPHQKPAGDILCMIQKYLFPPLRRLFQRASFVSSGDLDARLQKEGTETLLAVVLWCVIYFYLLGWREMKGGLNEWCVSGEEEEIPLCGWNWLVSLEGGMGDTWCRGCCQTQDSRVFVFSIITRFTSSSPPPLLLPSRKDHSAFNFQFFLKLVDQWSANIENGKTKPPKISVIISTT